MPDPVLPLARFTGPVVADSSVVINLNATRRAKAILGALSNQVLVTEQVLGELSSGRGGEHRDSALLAELIAGGFLEAVRIGESSEADFIGLVSGAASETLGDGEAATIAKALEVGGLALLDDRKALRICTERFPNLPTSGTVDLLRDSRLTEALTEPQLSDTVFRAVHDARMHVPPHHGEWVIGLLGIERARRCPSLARILRSMRNPRQAESRAVQAQRH